LLNGSIAYFVRIVLNIPSQPRPFVTPTPPDPLEVDAEVELLAKERGGLFSAAETEIISVAMKASVVAIFLICL